MKTKRSLVCAAVLAAAVASPAARPCAAADPDPAQDDAAVEPDNTARNVRDREGKTRTPIDQSNEPGDLAITQHIRKTVVANDELSTDAHNVKIITVDRVVTLRGPVDSEEERAFIVATAESAPQVAEVHDQLEVARPSTGAARPPSAAGVEPEAPPAAPAAPPAPGVPDAAPDAP